MLLMHVVLFTCLFSRTAWTISEENHDLARSGPTPGILKVLQQLRWKTVAVIQTEEYGSVANALQPNPAGVSILVYNINPSTADLTLRQIHNQLFPDVNIIVDVQPEFLKTFMRFVDTYDNTTNFATYFYHHSKWLILATNSDILEMGKELNHLENVAVLIKKSKDNATKRLRLSCCATEFCSLAIQCNWDSFEELFTLHHHPTDKDFLPVKLECEEPVCYFPNTKYGYNKKHLRVMTLPSVKYVVRENGDRTPFYTGYAFDIFNIMVKELNFSYTVQEPLDSSWGLKRNETWNGIVGQLIDRNVDIAVCDLSIDEKRSEVVDYIYPPIAIDRMSIAYKTQHQSPLLLLARPFRMELYLTIVASLISVMLLFKIIEHQRAETDQVCSWKFLKSTTDDPNPVGRAFIKQGAVVTINDRAGRILLTSWWMFVIIVTSVYCANLVASFSVQKEIATFSNIQELIDSDYGILKRKDGISFYLLQHSKLPIMQQLVKRIDAVPFNNQRSGSKEIIAKVKNGKFVWMTYLSRLEGIMAEDCDIKTMPEYLTWEHISFAVQKGSPFKHDLENVMSKIKESGIIDVLWRKWFKTRNSTMCNTERKVQPVSLGALGGGFIVLLAGLAVSSLILGLEHIRCVNLLLSK